MARIELGEMGRVDARLLLRCVRAEPKLAWFAEALATDIAATEHACLAPWRKVVAHERGLGRGRERLECGHSYVHRCSKNWEEDWAKKRRCTGCLRAETAASPA